MTYHPNNITLIDLKSIYSKNLVFFLTEKDKTKSRWLSLKGIECQKRPESAFTMSDN